MSCPGRGRMVRDRLRRSLTMDGTSKVCVVLVVIGWHKTPHGPKSHQDRDKLMSSPVGSRCEKMQIRNVWSASKSKLKLPSLGGGFFSFDISPTEDLDPTGPRDEEQSGFRDGVEPERCVVDT
jgi:hypothetical protein